METVSRYIDADILAELVEEEFDGIVVYDVPPDEAVADICDIIDSCPTVDVAPVVHGKWAFQYSTTDPEPFYSFCSHCRKPIKSTRAYHIYKFCPLCGAKMDESEE